MQEQFLKQKYRGQNKASYAFTNTKLFYGVYFFGGTFLHFSQKFCMPQYPFQIFSTKFMVGLPGTGNFEAGFFSPILFS